MSILSGRLGLVVVLVALCLGGRTAHAQVAPVPYWIPSWPFAFGNLPSGQNATPYGYNLPNGWFGVAQGGTMGLTTSGINQYAAFDNFGSLNYQSAQFGYNFQAAGGLPFKVYAGFDTVNFNTPGIGNPFTTSDTMSGTLSGYGAHAGVEFQPAPNVSLSLGLGYTQFGR
jgi:hypothetical protein